MSTALPVGTAWFPLIPRPRPPGLPLETRVAELATLAASAEAGTRQQRATRAAKVLNMAALIASDCGIPALARELCHRQYQLLARSAPLPGWAVRLAMQPVLNIPRQLIRDGHGDDAHAMLQALHAAALSRATVVVDDMEIDFATLVSTADGCKEACTLTWTTLLADGTRALAQAGRWKEAAEHAAAHRGIGTRLLDGRQAAILALTQDGQPGKAAAMVEQSMIAEPWEHAVQNMLRVLCIRATGTAADQHVAAMLADALALTEDPDQSTTVMRARVGMLALDLAGTSHEPQSRPLHAALIAAARCDAYAARDVLAHRHARKYLTTVQRRDLHDLVRACGLGAGTIPERLLDQITTAVDHAEVALKRELEQQKSKSRSP